MFYTWSGVFWASIAINNSIESCNLWLLWLSHRPFDTRTSFSKCCVTQLVFWKLPFGKFSKKTIDILRPAWLLGFTSPTLVNCCEIFPFLWLPFNLSTVSHYSLKIATVVSMQLAHRTECTHVPRCPCHAIRQQQRRARNLITTNLIGEVNSLLTLIYLNVPDATSWYHGMWNWDFPIIDFGGSPKSSLGKTHEIHFRGVHIFFK